MPSLRVLFQEPPKGSEGKVQMSEAYPAQMSDANPAQTAATVKDGPNDFIRSQLLKAEAEGREADAENYRDTLAILETQPQPPKPPQPDQAASGRGWLLRFFRPRRTTVEAVDALAERMGGAFQRLETRLASLEERLETGFASLEERLETGFASLEERLPSPPAPPLQQNVQAQVKAPAQVAAAGPPPPFQPPVPPKAQLPQRPQARQRVVHSSDESSTYAEPEAAATASRNDDGDDVNARLQGEYADYLAKDGI